MSRAVLRTFYEQIAYFHACAGRMVDKVRTYGSVIRDFRPHLYSGGSRGLGKGFCIHQGLSDRRNNISAPIQLPTAGFQLRYGHRYLGATIEPLAVICDLTNHPGCVNARNRGGCLVVTVFCIYHHLPLFYHFSDGWGFAFWVYAQKCWISTDYKGLNATIWRQKIQDEKSSIEMGFKRPRVRISTLGPKKQKKH